MPKDLLGPHPRHRQGRGASAGQQHVEEGVGLSGSLELAHLSGDRFPGLGGEWLPCLLHTGWLPAPAVGKAAWGPTDSGRPFPDLFRDARQLCEDALLDSAREALRALVAEGCTAVRRPSGKATAHRAPLTPRLTAAPTPGEGRCRKEGTPNCAKDHMAWQ